MKKLLLTGVLGLGLLLPTTISASADHSNSKATTEFFSKKQRNLKPRKAEKQRKAKPEAPELILKTKDVHITESNYSLDQEEDVIITPETAKNT